MLNNKTLIDFLATGFYSGKSPICPGTCGTFVIYLITLFVSTIFNINPPLYISLPLALIVIYLSIVISNAVLKLEIYGKNKDPKEIVIDEFAGYLTTIAILPWTPIALTIAFVMFRIFDATKLGFIKRCENYPDGYGITFDDVAAGVVAGIYTLVFVFALGQLSSQILQLLS